MITHSTSMPEMRESVCETSTTIQGGHPRCLLEKEKSQRRLTSIPVVMFADSVNVHQIESYEESEKRWYTNGEYFFIKKDALNTVRRMNNSNIKESNSVSTRGLEIVECEALRRRKQAISSAVSTVLNEKGAPPEAIAVAYRNATMESVEKSIEMAASDAKDAECILKDVREDLEKNSCGKSKKARDVMPLLSWLVSRRTKRS
mmetsp:Transcript_108283/g.162015  ORF Transcript_108283/g.162015 Transcript_108283/m.162015 type:complete len:203 (-) Transcript_108283:109-717(-)